MTFRDAVLRLLPFGDWNDVTDLADAITKLHDETMVAAENEHIEKLEREVAGLRHAQDTAVETAVKPWREALIGCAMNDRTPLYEYPGNCRTKKQVEECRDQCGYLPRRGSRWQTPEEIARDMLGADFDKMITAECHTRALLSADKAGEK